LISDTPKIVHYLKPKVEDPEFSIEEDVREPNVELDADGSALPDITIQAPVKKADNTNWQTMWDGIQDMRSTIKAPIDSIGVRQFVTPENSTNDTIYFILLYAVLLPGTEE
jgi:hypothetical protein